MTQKLHTKFETEVRQNFHDEIKSFIHDQLSMLKEGFSEGFCEKYTSNFNDKQGCLRHDLQKGFGKTD